MGRPAYIAKFVKRSATGNRRRDAEIEKRARLQADLEAALEQPLNPDVRLGKRELDKIEEKVRRGRCGQSFHAQGGSAGTRTVDA